MNRYFAALLLTCSGLLANGQATMNIYQFNGSILQINLSSIDSVTYLVTPPPPLMQIYQVGGSILSLAVADIDSITYSGGGSVGTPQLATLPPVNVSSSSADCGGYISSQGGSAVVTRGVCWSTSLYPTTADNTTVDGSGTGTYTSSMSGLSPNTTYYARAYAINSQGVAYGNLVAFATSNTGNQPTLITAAVTNVNGSSAQSGGTVITDGGETIIARGVCWNTSPNPTTANSISNSGSGVGSFSSGLSGLLPNTTYYVRAWATNIFGTGYGSQWSFTTTDGLPSGVTTAAITNILAITASGGGAVTSDGGFPLSARGVCWSTAPNPTTANSLTTNGGGTGTFTSNLTGLLSSTLYYVRAYATNTYGTVYGNEVSFTTTDGLPSGITTAAITNVIYGSATSGGSIANNGGYNVTSRGVCYSLTPNPTTADNLINEGNGIGSFTCDLVGLLHDTTYYVRAFAVNSFGTAYGNEEVFYSPVFFVPGPGVTDIDGNQYQTVIRYDGVETMAENLRTTRFANGDVILNLVDSSSWVSATGPAWCNYANNSGNDSVYGKLYNHFTVVDPRGLCPANWHQYDYDFQISLDGGSNKATGTIQDGTGLWESPNVGATNITGLSFIPGGARGSNGQFGQIGTDALYFIGPGGMLFLSYSNSSAFGDPVGGDQTGGASVRCIRD